MGPIVKNALNNVAKAKAIKGFTFVKDMDDASRKRYKKYSTEIMQSNNIIMNRIKEEIDIFGGLYPLDVKNFLQWKYEYNEADATKMAWNMSTYMKKKTKVTSINVEYVNIFLEILGLEINITKQEEIR